MITNRKWIVTVFTTTSLYSYIVFIDLLAPLNFIVHLVIMWTIKVFILPLPVGSWKFYNLQYQYISLMVFFTMPPSYLASYIANYVTC